MNARLFATPDNPVPDGAQVGLLPAHDRRNIRYATFEAAGRPAQGTVILLSGRNETIEKYFETVRDLAGRGFHVAALDWRGQGGSDRLLRDGARGHVRSFDDYVADLLLFVGKVVAPTCPPPFFVLAHSTGALVALLAAPELGRSVRRMVFTAPFLGFTGVPLAFPSLHRLSRIMSLAGLGSRYVGGGPKPRINTVFGSNVLTSDTRRFERNRALLEQFPMLGLGGPTVSWVRAACDAIAAVNDPAFTGRVRVPILLLAAGTDRVVSTPATEAYALKLPTASLVTVDGARHELLQEADRFRDQALAAFDAFVPGEAAAEPALSRA